MFFFCFFMSLAGLFAIMLFYLVACLIFLPDVMRKFHHQLRMQHFGSMWGRRPKFRRQKLAYYLVMRCLQRVGNRPPCLNVSIVPKTCPSRPLKWVRTWNKLHGNLEEQDWPNFIEPTMPDFAITCLENTIPDDTLSSFCSKTDFLSPVRLLKGFSAQESGIVAQQVVDRYNSHYAQMLLEAKTGPISAPNFFKHCPLVWDTGASHGLTPF